MKRFFKGLALTVATIIVFISTCSIFFLFSLTSSITEKHIKDIVLKTSINEMAENNPEVKEEINSLLEPIYEETRQLGIPDEIVFKVVDSKEIKELTGDVTSNILNYIITGKDQKLLSEKNIDSLIDITIDTINNNSSYVLSDADKKEVIRITNEEYNKYKELVPNTSSLDSEFTSEEKEVLNFIRFMFGFKIKLYFIIALVISSLSIILLRLKNFKWIKHLSITEIVSSICISITAAALLGISKLAFSTEIAELYNMIKKISLNIIIAAGIVIVISIILLIIYKFLQKQKVEIKKDESKLDETN